jgi:hypothetical protein
MKPRKFFDDNVSNEIQEEIVRIIYLAYQDTINDLKEQDYPRSYYKDLFGQLLRAKIDIYLHQLSKRYSQQIKANIELNKAKNSHHALIISDKIIMTASAVQHETDIPRKAIFRACLAALTQGEFDFDEDTNSFTVPYFSHGNESPPNSKLYAIIIHGPADDNRYLPGFIKVAFLDYKMNRLCADIDLMKKHREVVDNIITFGTEEIPDKITIEPNIKTKFKQGSLL